MTAVLSCTVKRLDWALTLLFLFGLRQVTLKSLELCMTHTSWAPSPGVTDTLSARTINAGESITQYSAHSCRGKSRHNYKPPIYRNVRRILVRGINASLPPEAKKILKIWLRNGAFWSICGQHSAVLYTCLPWLLSKYNINIENCSFCMFSLFNFSSIFPGGWLHFPIRVDAHAYTLCLKKNKTLYSCP